MSSFAPVSRFQTTDIHSGLDGVTDGNDFQRAEPSHDDVSQDGVDPPVQYFGLGTVVRFLFEYGVEKGLDWAIDNYRGGQPTPPRDSGQHGASGNGGGGSGGAASGAGGAGGGGG